MHAEPLSRDPIPTPARHPRVLLVEDSVRLASSIRDYLERHGYDVTIEGDGLVAAERFDRLKPELVVLDLMLPGKDGLTICRELRARGTVPILILTAKGENIDQVLGLEMGADDYVVKPVEPRVLLARIEALLRRAGTRPGPAPETSLIVGRLAIDGARRCGHAGRSLRRAHHRRLRHPVASRRAPRHRGDSRRDPARRARHRLRRPRPLHRRAHLPPAPQAPGRGRCRVDDQDRAPERVPLHRRRLGARLLRLFLRLYVFLMLPATAAFVFFMYVTDQVMAQMDSEQQRMRAGVAFDRAERIITDTRVPDWQGRLKEIEKTFRVEHEIVSLDKALDDFFMSSVGEGPAASGRHRISRPARGRLGLSQAHQGFRPGAAHRVGGRLRIPAHLLRASSSR